MSLPRLFLDALPAVEGQLVPLGPEAVRHLKALRLKPGAALELVLGDQAWTADLAALGIQPVVYDRSEFDAGRTRARMERWARIIQSASEQSHRAKLPELRPPVPFAALLTWKAPQKWVAYELITARANPALVVDTLAFTSGPEGGITDGEFAALTAADWQPVSLGRSILRAVTTPVALLGAVQFELGRSLHP